MNIARVWTRIGKNVRKVDWQARAISSLEVVKTLKYDQLRAIILFGIFYSRPRSLLCFCAGEKWRYQLENFDKMSHADGFTEKRQNSCLPCAAPSPSANHSRFCCPQCNINQKSWQLWIFQNRSAACSMDPCHQKSPHLRLQSYQNVTLHFTQISFLLIIVNFTTLFVLKK